MSASNWTIGSIFLVWSVILFVFEIYSFRILTLAWHLVSQVQNDLKVSVVSLSIVTEACYGMENTLLDSLLLFGFWNQVSQIQTTNIIFLV